MVDARLPPTIYTKTMRDRDWAGEEKPKQNGDSNDLQNNEAPFLPHSEHTVFGLDNSEQYWEHYVQNNFHARILRQLNPDLLHFPVLDNYMGEFIKRRVCMGIELQELDQQIVSTTAQLDKVRTQRTKHIANTAQSQ